MTKKTGREVANVLIPILYGLMAIGVALLVCGSGQYPFGSATMTHIYRGNLFYNAIQNGSIFPLYDPMWYNGVEVLRYCGPLPYYFLALCQILVGGDPIDAYLMFVGLVFFLGACFWFFIGKKKKRVFLGGFIGALWFFMPHNLFVLFFEGNLPRAFCMIILPIFVSCVYDYVLQADWKKLIGIIFSYAGIALCDLEYAIMAAIGFVIFMLIYGIIYHQWKKSLNVLSALVLGILVTGLWTIPSLIATAGTSNVETMYRYFQSIFKTLNPIERYLSINKYYYFGLAAFLLSIFGIIFSKKKSMPGFWTSIIILCCTTASMYSIMIIVPGREYLLMCQYISLALCFILYGFLLWDTLRKPIQIILCILLVLDVVPSLNLVYGTMSGVSVTERFNEQDETTLILSAKEVSQQRVALMDESVLEAMGAYLVSGYENGKAATFGSEWTTATTASNIKQLNRALTSGFYPYMFDRCMELGNDTVLVKLSQINVHEAPVEMLDEAAKEAGYELAGSNEFYRLYDMNIEGNWGTVTSYPAIGIGTGAPAISLCYPAVQEVSSTNLNDYTFEELSKYELIYLAGFTYDDRQSAEEMILRLSEAGVRIVILADGIPEDRVSHTSEFLGITCNDITFSNGYPLLDTKIGVLDCDFFPQGFEKWETVYVNGLDTIWGTVREENLDLPFYGTVKNDNIIVLGLNLTYFYSMTRDEGVGELLSDITEFAQGRLPEREIVPITVEYGNNSLIITSEMDKVNTSLAYHEMFNSAQGISQENNLLYVNAGTTYIDMDYPYFKPGLAVMIMGSVLTIVFLYAARKQYSTELKKNESANENVL